MPGPQKIQSLWFFPLACDTLCVYRFATCRSAAPPLRSSSVPLVFLLVHPIPFLPPFTFFLPLFTVATVSTDFLHVYKPPLVLNISARRRMRFSPSFCCDAHARRGL